MEKCGVQVPGPGGHLRGRYLHRREVKGQEPENVHTVKASTVEANPKITSRVIHPDALRDDVAKA
jgi:hypothetical protein